MRGLLWPESVYGVAGNADWRWLEHTGWVAFIDYFLIKNCVRGNQDTNDHAELLRWTLK